MKCDKGSLSEIFVIDPMNLRRWMEMGRLERYSTLTVTLQVQEAELLQLMTYERLNENSVAPISAGTLLQSLRITTSTNRQQPEHSSTTRAQIVFITAALQHARTPMRLIATIARF